MHISSFAMLWEQETNFLKNKKIKSRWLLLFYSNAIAFQAKIDRIIAKLERNANFKRKPGKRVIVFASRQSSLAHSSPGFFSARIRAVKKKKKPFEKNNRKSLPAVRGKVLSRLFFEVQYHMYIHDRGAERGTVCRSWAKCKNLCLKSPSRAKEMRLRFWGAIKHAR